MTNCDSSDDESVCSSNSSGDDDISITDVGVAYEEFLAEAPIVASGIVCIACAEQLLQSEDYVMFQSGDVWCMECAEDLEHSVEITDADDETDVSQ